MLDVINTYIADIGIDRTRFFGVLGIDVSSKVSLKDYAKICNALRVPTFYFAKLAVRRASNQGV